MSWVCGHLLGLWSFPGWWSVVMSWSVVITLVCGNFLARGLWSYPGWICHHFLNLWSLSGSWAVVMSFIGLWPCPGSVVIGHQGTMPASRRWGAYENQKITREIVGIRLQLCEFLIGTVWHSRTSSARHQEIADFRGKSRGGTFENAKFRHFSKKEIS